MGCASTKHLPRDEFTTAPQPQPAIVSAAESGEEDEEPVVCRTLPRLNCLHDYELLIDGYLRMHALWSTHHNNGEFLIMPHLIKTYFYPRYIVSPICSGLDDLSAAQFQRLFDLSHELTTPDSLSCNNMQWHIATSDANKHYVSEAGLTQFDSIDYGEYGVQGEFDVISSGMCATHTFVSSYSNGKQYVYYSTLQRSSRSHKRKFYNLINLPFTNQGDRITQMRCGYEYCLFLTEQGVVWSRGTNQYGQIGQHKGIVHIPTMSKIEYIYGNDNHEEITNIPKIRAICCGYDHNLMIDIDDNVWIFGHTSHGQLGVQSASEHNVIYKAMLHPWFHKKTTHDINSEFNSNVKVKHISCGLRHSLCIDSTGRVYLFGDNQYGQIGNGKINTIQYTPYLVQCNEHIVLGECGEMHTVLLNASNELLTFGRNLHGECSSLLRSTNTLSSPHVLSRQREMRIHDTDVIHSVLVSKACTVVVVNMIQTRLNRIQTDYSQQLHSTRATRC